MRAAEMLETPNKEHIDRFAEDLRERYAYEKLRHWALDDLQGEQHLVKNEFMRFRATFPSKGSVLQGAHRQALLDDPTDDKETLTTIEKERLGRLERDIQGNIKRAIGVKEQEQADRRDNRLDNLTQSLTAIAVTLKELKPW